MRANLRAGAERALAGRETFLSRFEAEIDAHADPETATRIRQATPSEQQWLGLERYWAKREAAGAA